MCSTWLPTVRGAIESRRAICCWGGAPGQQHEHLGLAGGQSGDEPAPPPDPMTGGGEDGPYRVGVQQARGDLVAERGRALGWRQRRPVRAVLAERPVEVGGREQPGGDGDRGTCQAAGVAGAVHPLMAHAGEAPDRREGRLTRQDPLGEVRDRAHPLHSAPESRVALSQIPADTPIAPSRWTRAARRTIVTSAPGSPYRSAASAASVATPCEWPSHHGDFRSA